MHRIIRYFYSHSSVLNLILVIILAAGVFSLTSLRRESYPPTDVDTMVIHIFYPGASTEDVERSALMPIEDVLSGIGGIKEYSSLSSDNKGVIHVSLDDTAGDIKSVKDEIYRSVSKNSIPEIPDGVEDIIIKDINPRIMTIVSAAIIPRSDSFKDFSAARSYALKLKDRIGGLPGVSTIRTRGIEDREFHINVIPEKLDYYHLSLNDVLTAVKKRNIRGSGGTLKTGEKESSIITMGQFDSVKEINGAVIRSNYEGYQVHIGDVAEVTDSFEEGNLRYRINGRRGFLLGIRKKENADIIDTVSRVREFLTETEEQIPEGVTVNLVSDDAEYIRSNLKVVTTNGIIGFVIVFAVLLVFLDAKTSFWTALGIPISLAMVFTYMNLAGLSFNILSLGAITTVLGMMVDHGIVISEIIFEKKKEGHKPIDAAIAGVREVFYPVLITVLTTVFAFMPLMSVTGIMGKFIFIYPLVITATLTASFIEANFFLPAHLGGGATEKEDPKSQGVSFDGIRRIYGLILSFVLKGRYIFVPAFLLLFLLSIVLSGDTIKNFVLFYDDASQQIVIRLETPEGSGLDFTEKVASEIEGIISETIEEDELKSYISTIGNYDTSIFETTGDLSNLAIIEIDLVPYAQRERSAGDIAAILDEKIKRSAIKDKLNFLSVEESGSGPELGSGMDVNVLSPHSDDAEAIAEEIVEYISSIKGVMNVDSNYSKSKKEVSIDFDYIALGKTGITVDAVAQTIHTAYEGSIASSIQTIDERIDFRVQVSDSYLKDSEYLYNLQVPNREGRLVRIRDFADIHESRGQVSVTHHNGERIISVSADTDNDNITSSKLSRMVAQKFHNIGERFPGSSLSFEGESKETSESMRGLTAAFTIALMLIYFVMVMLFNSLSQPFIVIFTIPLGIVGALAALALHGMPLSFMALIGIIGLSGVVVNDSVVMVDFINKVYSSKDKAGSENIGAVVNGAMQRLRPVLLTTITTVAALLPSVYGIGGNLTTLRPAVLTMAYGLLFATSLTLFFIPALYMLNQDVKILFSTLKTIKFTAKSGRKKSPGTSIQPD